MYSAEIPCGTISKRSSTSGAIEPLFDPIGTRDIISTPPETTTSSWPDQTAAAALKFVCMDEPHWRSTVVPATLTGQPAVNATLRPMFHACSSIWVTQPHWTSSTSPGSRSLRSTRAFSTCAESWSPRIEASVPFRRPIGLRTASTMRASGIGDSIDRPGSRNAFQLVLAARLEDDPRAGHEILDGARDEDLSGRRVPRDARAHVHREARRLAVDQLALAGVDSGADVQAEGARSLHHCTSARDRPRRPVETDEEPVPRGVDLDAAVALELAPDLRPLGREQLTPAAVAELRRPLGGADEVGEEECREDGVRDPSRRHAAEERVDGLEREVVLHDGHADPGDLDELGVRDELGHLDRLLTHGFLGHHQGR